MGGIVSAYTQPADKYVLRIAEDSRTVIKPSFHSDNTIINTANNTSSPSNHNKPHRHHSNHAIVVPIISDNPNHNYTLTHTNSTLTSNKNDKNITTMDNNSSSKETYTYGQPSRLLTKQTSHLPDNIKLRKDQKQNSNLHTNSNVSTKNMNNNNNNNNMSSSHLLTRQTTQPITHQPSFHTNSSIKVNNNNSTKINNGSNNHGVSVCARDYPWLIKSAHFAANVSVSELEPGRIIGKGLMGTVRLAKFKHQEKYFVLKSIQKEYIIRHNDLRHVQNEKNILMQVHTHPFIVRLFGTFQNRQHIFFALQYCPGGELYRRLTKVKRFSPEAAKFYVTEVVSALSYVQSLGIVYRDLKPENVMIDEEGHVKLVDFGFAIRCGSVDSNNLSNVNANSNSSNKGTTSTDLNGNTVLTTTTTTTTTTSPSSNTTNNNNNNTNITGGGTNISAALTSSTPYTEEKMHTLCGTPAYLSPEQLDGKLTNGYTRVVDWWSLGVLIFELLTGKTPFVRNHNDSHYEIFLRILHHKISFPYYFEATAKDLVRRLCHPQLPKRLCDRRTILSERYFVIDWSSVDSRLLVPPYVPKLKTAGGPDSHCFEQYHDNHDSLEENANHNHHNLKNSSSSSGKNEGAYEYFDF